MSTATIAQQPAAAPKPIPMPPERAADSYAIYSQLMPGQEFRDTRWPKKQWLIETVTITFAAKGSCDDPGRYYPPFFESPHSAIRAPEGRQADLTELLNDFDQHCRDAVLLERERLQLSVPFQLLGPKAREELIHTWDRNKTRPAKYDGAPGLNSFSEVYFNRARTLAMVFSNQWCGLLCGTSYWTVLERRDGRWDELPWVFSSTVY